MWSSSTIWPLLLLSHIIGCEKRWMRRIYIHTHIICIDPLVENFIYHSFKVLNCGWDFDFRNSENFDIYCGKLQINMVNVAAIAVAIRFQRLWKLWYYSCNHNCGPHFKMLCSLPLLQLASTTTSPTNHS